MPGRKTKKGKTRCTRTVLRIPDLEQSKTAVLNSLPAKTSQESYAHAIDEFIAWYCSEPRLAFNRPVVLRYRIYLEQKNLAPSTINVRLAAVRRLAYEAADTGLLSPELAAGIRRVKGAKRLGVRIGNWLTAEQGRTLLQSSGSDTLRGKRDRAILSVLLGCGLRRAELVALRRAKTCRFGKARTAGVLLFVRLQLDPLDGEDIHRAFYALSRQAGLG